MEYRRRRRRRSHTGSGAGRAFIVLIVAAAGIYLISASFVGTWIAQNITAPMFTAIETAFMGAKAAIIGEKDPATKDSDIAAPPEAIAKGPSVSEKVSLPGVECYMLQMGVYSSSINAKKQSDAIRARGAGGYIIEDGGKFRVIASGYNDEASLKTVRSQLTDAETASYIVSEESLSFNITASENELSALKSGFGALKVAQSALSDLAISFDGTTKTPSEGRAISQGILDNLKAANANLTAHKSDDEILAKLNGCYKSSIEALTKLCEDNTESFVDFSANIKYTQLQVTYEYANLLAALS